MSDSELRKACERLRADATGDRSEAARALRYEVEKFGNWPAKMAADRRLVSDAYLAEHPADDAEPVTEGVMSDSEVRAADDDEPTTVEWLLATGWQLGHPWPSFPLEGQGDTIEWRGHGVWVGETPLCRAPARGHIRAILRVLGVGKG